MLLPDVIKNYLTFLEEVFEQECDLTTLMSQTHIFTEDTNTVCT